MAEQETKGMRTFKFHSSLGLPFYPTFPHPPGHCCMTDWPLDITNTRHTHVGDVLSSGRTWKERKTQIKWWHKQETIKMRHTT